jgi:hypothetical protein
VNGSLQENAVGLVKEYKSGIRNRKFGLEALKKQPSTVRRKRGIKTVNTAERRRALTRTIP